MDGDCPRQAVAGRHGTPHDLESPVVDRPCVLCVFPHRSIESLYRLHCVATGVDDNSRLWILYFTVSVCDEEFPIE